MRVNLYGDHPNPHGSWLLSHPCLDVCQRGSREKMKQRYLMQSVTWTSQDQYTSAWEWGGRRGPKVDGTLMLPRPCLPWSFCLRLQHGQSSTSLLCCTKDTLKLSWSCLTLISINISFDESQNPHGKYFERLCSALCWHVFLLLCSLWERIWTALSLTVCVTLSKSRYLSELWFPYTWEIPISLLSGSEKGLEIA